MLRRLAILGLLLSIASAIGVYRTLPSYQASGLRSKAHAEQDNMALVGGLPEDVNQQVLWLKRLSPQALHAYQQARLKADIHRLACGQMTIEDGSAQVLYGPDWQQKTARYKATRERDEYILSGSLFGMLIGIGLLILCILWGTIMALLAGVRWVWRGLFVRKAVHAATTQAQSKDNSADPGTGRAQVKAAPAGRRKVALDTRPVEGQHLPYLRQYPQDHQPTDPVGDGRLATAGAVLSEPVSQCEDGLPLAGQGAKGSGLIISTLSKLNEQITAIRQYAAQQQQRVARLESGYDWSIIRAFCLKIIRCLDNIEERICQDANNGLGTEQLEQVRDELLFALEASGLEQFRPQVGQTMDGLHGQVEVAKERQAPPDPALSGRIAQVLRPGYRYLVDHQQARVVRMARVCLYG